jgi:hypothetical protein
VGARARTALVAALALSVVLSLAILGTGHAQVLRDASAASTLIDEQLLAGEEEQKEGRFGASVAISADGSTAIVGGPGDNGRVGAVWMFARSEGMWVQQGPKLTPESEGTAVECEELEGEPEACGVGRSVALSADGNVALVGAPRNKGHQGAAWVYTRSGSTWTKSARLTGEEAVGAARFGRSVALSADGSLAVVGGALDAFGHGAVWIFKNTGGGWVRAAKLIEPGERGESFFGASVALSRDGTTLLIGAPGRERFTGAAWLFTRSGETWTADPNPFLGGEEEIGRGRFGFSVALNADATLALVGARTDNGRGAAWAFTRNGSAWTPQKLTAAGEAEAFGYSVALTASGEEALVGAPAAAKFLGRAWFFTRRGSSYIPVGSSVSGREPAAERLGTSVALSQTGAEALLGAPTSNSLVGSVVALLGMPVPAPTVTSISPSSGPRTGGTAVTIEGSGFLPGATVTIGGREATSVEVLSNSKLTAQTPANAAGSYAVAVSDESGTSSGGPSYTYEPPPTPVVTSVTPPSGPSVGGTLITIEGSNFLPGATVTIGGREATSVEVLSETMIRARTPRGSGPGAYDVVVSNEGVSSSAGPRFTYEGPTGTAASNGPTITPKLEVLATTTTVPPPVLAVSGNIAPLSGKVYVRLPGTNKFVLLTGLRNIPFGTIVDAREGTATVTTQGKKGLQSVNFYEGEFKLTQGKNGVVTAALYGGSFSVCPTARERAHRAHASAHHVSRRHIVRKLWASGHGTYSTKGNYATGAVLGTVWETIDRCNGTGIHVVTDSVLVTNLVTHKKVRVKAGHTYIAAAP